MKDLIIPKETYTPEVNFRFGASEGFVKGVSTPENTFQFYEKVIVWIESFLSEKEKKFTLNIELDYYNTSTANVLNNIFGIMQKAQNGSVVNWLVEDDDDDYIEAGTDFAELFPDLEFNVKLLPATVDDFLKNNLV